MPRLGFGVWQIPDGPETERAVRWALDAGYRLLDTAQAYRNEASVGRALAASGTDRDQVFVTTKFDPARADPVAEAKRSLERLGIDRLDLYLVHWPQGGPTRAWPGMERALSLGLTKAIGVSNFDASQLRTVVERAEMPPAVNQVQLSPFQYRRGLLDACERLGVVAEAYSPLTTGRCLDHPTVAAVALRAGCTRAQVLLNWGLRRGFVVVTKSTHRERMLENWGALDVDLTGADLAELDALDRTGGTDRALEEKWWPEGRVGEAMARLRERLSRG